VNNNSKGEKEDLNNAFSGIYKGLSNIFDECMVVGRYSWNMEMRIIKSVGVMPFFSGSWISPIGLCSTDRGRLYDNCLCSRADGP
jgi:hypothetical protein